MATAVFEIVALYSIVDGSRSARTPICGPIRHSVATINISALLPRANLTSARKVIESLFSAGQPTAEPNIVPDAPTTYLTQLGDLLAGRTALENTSILLALCTFAVLAMSWATRFNNLGRFSPFTRSPPTGSGRVSDADFSYITADDLRQHNSNATDVSHSHQHQRAESPVDYGPPRDTDCLMLRNKKRDFLVHFPAYSIAKGELTIGQVREQAAKKLGTADLRRIKLLYKGKNLKEDSRTCKHEGLRHEAELLCTVADSVGDASEDEEDDDEGLGDDGTSDQVGADGETKRRRNRGKKSKRRNKREQTSGTSTPSEYPSNLAPPLQTGQSSTQHSRAPSPKAPGTPLTAMDKMHALRDKFASEYLPQAQSFIAHPPADQSKRDFDHKRLSETILAQILLKLDAVETEGDLDARATRKELVRQVQAVLTELDGVMKR
ncbi:hypothetical protein LTR97_000509 [Elasticomyces elasticus]|uniref:BAG domain-containing protein n=1 Tax=Elasticomyces elasticus TaxID=574655 RepID=A0AAN7WKD7_9PEZI|nr:hypothetical protein LTR97_000509 [Elasticomyces elasticus]